MSELARRIFVLRMVMIMSGWGRGLWRELRVITRTKAVIKD
jgi:hypothetical protein